MADKPQKGKEVRFKMDRETKNKLKFSEVPAEGEEEVTGTFYISKTQAEALGIKDTLSLIIKP